ncbi:MAG: hypothetical protein ABJE95_33600 [Byssovorax sp.]
MIRALLSVGTVAAIVAAATIAGAQTAQPAPLGAAAMAAQPPPPSLWGGMQAGGLTPPPPMPAGAPSTAGKTEELLDKSKKQNAGRRLEWLWVDVGGGFEHLGLRTFNPKNEAFAAGFVNTTETGGTLTGGLGARLLFFTLGARGRIAFFDSYNRLSLGPEVGFRFPIGNLEPHVDVGFGWTGLGSFNGTVAGDAGAISMRGVYARLGGGLDYYLSPVFSVGVVGSFELVHLTRPGISSAQLATIKALPSLTAAESARVDLLGTEATSNGGAFSATGQLGLHF